MFPGNESHERFYSYNEHQQTNVVVVYNVLEIHKELFEEKDRQNITIKFKKKKKKTRSMFVTQRKKRNEEQN